MTELAQDERLYRLGARLVESGADRDLLRLFGQIIILGLWKGELQRCPVCYGFGNVLTEAYPVPKSSDCGNCDGWGLVDTKR